MRRSSCIDVAPDELNTVQAQLASRDTFARYGLDWPGVSQRACRCRSCARATAAQVIKLKSIDPISDPFVTLLVEVNWSRGHLVREYTMLLDPPVYAPGQSPSQAPVSAPATGAGAREGAIARAAEAPPRRHRAPLRRGRLRPRRPRPQAAAERRRCDAAPAADARIRCRHRAAPLRDPCAGRREAARRTHLVQPRRDAVADRRAASPARAPNSPEGAQLDARDLPGESARLRSEHERAALGRGAAHARTLATRRRYPRRRRPPRSAVSTRPGAHRARGRPRGSPDGCTGDPAG